MSTKHNAEKEEAKKIALNVTERQKSVRRRRRRWRQYHSVEESFAKSHVCWHFVVWQMSFFAVKALTKMSCFLSKCLLLLSLTSTLHFYAAIVCRCAVNRQFRLNFRALFRRCYHLLITTNGHNRCVNRDFKVYLFCSCFKTKALYYELVQRSWLISHRLWFYRFVANIDYKL